MSSLSQLRDRVAQTLLDTASAIWTAEAIDEALRQALDQYSAANPLYMESVIVCPGAGREIALEGLSGLRRVMEVWWPYDSAASQETWPPNRVRGFRLYWDDARPVLFLDIRDGSQPQAGDEVRLWYSTRQTIQELDGADLTSLPAEDESLLVLGAAGQAALSHAVDLIEIAGSDLYQVGLLGAWGLRRLREFNEGLRRLQQASARSGSTWTGGWALDGWDEGQP